MIAAGRLPRSLVVASRMLPVARIGSVAVVPGLPCVAPDEAEAAVVRLQPARRRRAGRGRARWRSGAGWCPAGRPTSGWGLRQTAWPARRRSERRWRSTGTARPRAGGGGHAVEGQRDVGPHRLAHPVSQRAVVAAARAEGRHPQRGAQIRRDLRGRPRPHRNRYAGPALVKSGLDPGLAAHAHGHPRRREPAARKTHIRHADLHPIAARAPDRRPPGESEIHRQRQMPRIRQPIRQHRRLEQARIQLAHHLPRRHRCQIRPALMLAPRPQRRPERKQHHCPHQQQEHHPEHQQRGLAPLRAPTPSLIPLTRHVRRPCRATGYGSTRASNNIRTIV